MSQVKELYRKLQVAEAKTAIKVAELAAAKLAEDQANARYKEAARK